MRADVPLLTKSDYMAGLECPKKLYLRKYNRDLAEQPDAGAKARMADGQEIGLIARMLFPGGVLIDPANKDGVLATEIYMREAHTLFEAQFLSGGRLVRVDVLQRDGEGWRVLEVKSSKEPKAKEKFKDGHLYDLAFQVLVLREAGINVTSAGLILLSRTYCSGSDGGFSTKRLFAIRDVTRQVEELLVDTQFQSIRQLQVLGLEEEPTVETNVHCKGCDFHAYCHVGQREDDLVFLPRISAKEVTDLRSQGIRTIGQIPEDFKLSGVQRRIWESWRTGKPYVGDALTQDLAKITYPLYMIDFETTRWAIPYLPKTAAHQAIPFQWSCHSIEAPRGRPVHREFLYRGGEDPREEFVSTLLECIRGAATIATYTGYESTVVKDLVAQGIPKAKELAEILEARVLDLKKLVEERVYLKEFRGSFSLKSVLPALAPGHGYEDLRIRDGEAASAEYKRMCAPTTPPSETERVAQDLLAYCKRDTEAMVELLQALEGLVRPSGEEVVATAPPEETDRVYELYEQLVLNI
jgi:predicted RecB family nuclease